jgi:2-polyprenyl-3-methyl-5-hydroxy-6-metoxy-1,4-benzoquinol methylase
MNPNQSQCCAVCRHNAVPAEIQKIRSNVRRFRDQSFFAWRCANCRSLHSEKIENLADYYKYYPIRGEHLDYFWRVWYGVVLSRLVKAGLKPEHRILDYGCNTGVFLEFLKEKGYHNCFGYDPYVERFKSTEVLNARYDAVVSLDVIEHDENPAEFLARLSGVLKPGGILCIETPNAAGIDLRQTDIYLHALHMPYHTHILSEQGLSLLARGLNLETKVIYNRWYMDYWLPGTSRHLAEKLVFLGGNDIDVGYEPPRIDLFFKHPVLFVYLVFGYFLPPRKTDHMMMIFKTS